MNLRDLEYLVAVADQRSFRSAAAACGVSQPTLSVQLRKLEEELGVVLIDRAASRPVLTPIGQRVPPPSCGWGSSPPSVRTYYLTSCPTPGSGSRIFSCC